MAWMVSILLLISNYTSLFPVPFETVPSAPTIIGITVIFMFYIFFSSLTGARNFSILSLSLIFILWSAEMAKSARWHVLFLEINSPDVWSGLDGPFYLCPREFYTFHFQGEILVCAYTICQQSQTLISCTIPCESSFSSNHSYSYIPFVSVCCIRLMLLTV